MSRIYGRKYDLMSASLELTNSNLPKYKEDKRRVSFQDVFKAGDEIGNFISPKAISILESCDITVSRTIFNKSPLIIPANSMGKGPELILPTYLAKEEYKLDFANFLGDILTNNQSRKKEFGTLLPLMFEYFYLTCVSEDASSRFERRNLDKLVKDARGFIKWYNEYDKNPDLYELVDFENLILECMISFSSYDAALQLIDMYHDNPTETLNLIDKIATSSENSEEIMADAGITTYGYKTLRKSIDRRKSK